MIKSILLLVGLFIGFSQSIHAETYLHVGAYHPTTNDLSNAVYGFGKKKGDKLFGVYHNSWERFSLYYVKEKPLPWKVKWFYGGATGYSKIVIPSVGINIGVGRGVITLTPPIGSFSHLSLMFSIRL